MAYPMSRVSDIISQGTVRVKTPGHEFQELQMLEERARMGDDVSYDWNNLSRT
jgi:ArsR family transcriptional regulator